MEIQPSEGAHHAFTAAHRPLDFTTQLRYYRLFNQGSLHMQIAFTTFMLLCAAANANGLYEAIRYGYGPKTLYILGLLGGLYAAIPPCPFFCN